MGASVWAVVEYKEYDSYFSFAKIDLPRDIEFLCAIAWGDGGYTGDMPFPPRGFPSDASYPAQESFFVSRDEVKEYLENFDEDTEDETSLEAYARAYGDWAIKEYKSSGRLPMPELTGYGWLTLAELEANIAQRGLEISTLLPVTRAMLAAMMELAATYGRDGVRLVFWISM
ncbi:MAG: hypothetical protein ABI977_23650 [Acidobacteriota bacterium]